jgi:hypothetical protein
VIKHVSRGRVSVFLRVVRFFEILPAKVEFPTLLEFSPLEKAIAKVNRGTEPDLSSARIA